MLTRNQVERLEIIEQWLQEIIESDEWIECDIYPDVTLGDSLQGVQEILNAYYPEGYTPPKPTKHIYKVRPWHEKLKNVADAALSEISGVLVITAALSACASVVCWGASDAKDGFGYRDKPDFAAQSQIYRGVALASIGAAFGCGVVGSVINETRK
jgi:hypothetical protein